MNTSTYKVLFLEDEPTIREVLTEYMLISGYEVTAVERGDTAIELLQKDTYNIAVLDIMVPGVDGFAVLEYIQQHCSATAAIMLTALEDEKTQVRAFNLYADDYVIKPVSPIILLKRMETILRRTCRNYTEKEIQEEQQKGLCLKEGAYCAFYQNKKLPLTLSEYLLLQTLFKEPNRVFTREQHKIYMESGNYTNVQVKNPTACFSIKIPHEEDSIYLTAKFFSVKINMQEVKHKQVFSLFRSLLKTFDL